MLKLPTCVMALMLVLVVLQVSKVSGHSWIACTDYLVNNAADWESTDCRTYPRDGHSFTPKTSFGQDTGYNIINPPDNAPCKTTRDGDNADYNSEYPMAVYYLGQKVVLAHPTKNHVADVRCTNKYIPDNGNKIWRSGVNPQSDPTLQQFQQNEVADLGTSPTGHQIADSTTTTYPKPGYQNAPNFCQNPDKALATNMFVVPNNLQTGRYTFMWGWFFNSMQDLYTSCWEVDIVATKAERDQRYLAKSLSTADPQNVEGGDMPTPAPTQTSTSTRVPGGNTPVPTPASGSSSAAPPCDCSQCQTSGSSTARHYQNAAVASLLSIVIIIATHL